MRLCFGESGQHPDWLRDHPPPGLERVVAEFPTVALDYEGHEGHKGHEASAAVIVQASAWRGGMISLRELDHRVNELAARGPVTICVTGSHLEQVALEVLTRCQRWVGRRNQHSTSPVFDRVLSAHRALHDLCKPLVRADYDHALDVWQWMLRLNREASRAAQIAALFHDIERLVTEADARVEHQAADYDAFKRTHAARGARMTREVLATVDLDVAAREQAELLIALHDRTKRRIPGRQPAPGRGQEAMARELELLDDADGLSFFSLNSPGFFDYYGLAHTRHKIAWTLMRLSPRGRARLGEVKLRPDVARLVQEVMGNERSWACTRSPSSADHPELQKE
jgi:hypothetical protein